MSETTFALQRPAYHVGIDVGSTTVKAVVINAATGEVAYHTYRRHHAHQVESLRPVIAEIAAKFPDARMSAVMTGSGGKSIADVLGMRYIQEVVANSIAVRTDYPQARCAIELGGQDAKMIFFDQDEATGRLSVSDMRMNGSCAGGTGAFIDEIASLLKVPVEELDALAARGKTVYSISGRCGVYAKTDIQPLLNAGAAKEDIALSTFHAIAKQTLGGLAQGLDINPPVIFEGGPLTFNHTLVRVFAERLQLADGQKIRPADSETIVARGAALSVGEMFSDTEAEVDLASMDALLAAAPAKLAHEAKAGKPFFASEAEYEAFEGRHKLAAVPVPDLHEGAVVRAYLGIDSGSTTTKFVLLGEDGKLVDSFYAHNEGEPLDIATAALRDLNARYRAAGAKLEILGVGTTGYGEALFARAYHADCHMVETVAHAVAAAEIVPDATFILDIGGQDMKAIWVDHGIVTDILVNEACSSGCGSFLENFGASLGIPTREIAPAAFRATNPAVLGSRCTVFMNSSVVTEQKNGKSPDDIMAGLCRSIIENVFTKVIRVANTDVLGDGIVVQGGTFANDAVLAAFEQYVGKPVTRAPYPGLMGAIGAALLTKRQMEERPADSESTFIGLDALDTFSYTQQSNVTCPFCGNSCSRTIVTFADGTTSVTGNRCERGEVVGDPHDEAVRDAVRAANEHRASVPNLFKLRQSLLFADYPVTRVAPEQHLTIGLPRVLAFWDAAPFWTTLLRALGFKVKMSHLSTRRMYEAGLSAVTSDTVCFPAKLVHGHIRDLVKQRVDRIFMPIVTTVASENTASTSQSMCAVVKGFPMVVRNSDNPEERFGVPFDDPLFHWYTNEDRERQLAKYLQDTFELAPDAVRKALAQADAAEASFHEQLVEAGQKVLDDARAQGTYAVVLGSRPYHNDPLVNHDLPELFTSQGIAVLPPDAVPGVNDVDLSRSRIDIVNNFHARMLSAAVIAANSDHLESAQIVSFGCGHDAYLSDEIVRMMREIGGKSPLILKVDESDVPGPLRIRVRSFVETVNMRYRAEHAAVAAGETLPAPRELPDPYPQKFERADRKRRVVLVPNTSHAFARLMATVFARQGLTTVAMPIGRDEAIRLGKKYVHNDICFPAQITIGEALAELETGKYKDCEVAVGTGKYVGDCRLTHYAALLRRALDDAGYQDVAIITNDDVDAHDMQPGWKMNQRSAIEVAMCLPMIDVLEEMLRKIRPYELEKGAADAAFEKAIDALMDGLAAHGARGAEQGFSRAVDIMDAVAYDRSHPRPAVLIVGEYLLNFHPGANHDIERYLESNGFEIIEARMTDVIRKTYFYKDARAREYKVGFKLGEKAWYRIANAMFEHAHNVTDRIAAKSPLVEPATRMPELVKASDPIIHHTFDAGEGVLIPAEIIHHAEHGCRAFVILQPFGCLPNHVVGRGIAKRLKEMYPTAQILPLDYDPDVSFANLENRLQMLVMNARAQMAGGEGAAAAPSAADTPALQDARDAIAAVSSCISALQQVSSDIQSLVAQAQALVNENGNEIPMDALESHFSFVQRKLEDISRTVTDTLAVLNEARTSARRDSSDKPEETVTVYATTTVGMAIDEAVERAHSIASSLSSDLREVVDTVLDRMASVRADDRSRKVQIVEFADRDEMFKDAQVVAHKVDEYTVQVTDLARALEMSGLVKNTHLDAQADKKPESLR